MFAIITCLFENTPLEENFTMQSPQNVNCITSHHPHIKFWGHKLNNLIYEIAKKAPTTLGK
jgi:hypothetical protein